MRIPAVLAISLVLLAILILLYTNLNQKGSTAAARTMRVVIPAFANGSRIPVKYTCDGKDINPEIIIEDIPSNAKTLAIIVYDPDAPIGTFYHWLLYDIPVNGSKLVIPEGLPKTLETPYGFQGINDFGRIGYNGPCPPRGHGTHRYYFLVLALNIEIPPKQYLARNFEKLVKDHVIAKAIYMGTYSR